MSKSFEGFPVLIECVFGRMHTGLRLSKFTPTSTVLNRLRAEGNRVSAVHFDDQAKRWIAKQEHFA